MLNKLSRHWWLLSVSALLLAATLSGSGQAAEELLQFQSSEQQALFRELTAELRCPKCQNQNIADSNAVVAVDMRQKTYQLVQQGQNKQQVLAYMKQRYGDFVHYQPPVQWSTIWLWLLPVGLLTSMFVFMLRKGKADPAPQLQQPQFDSELQAIIDEVSVPDSIQSPPQGRRNQS
jgi:cytochrome c-type biogenesis protein CcmH